jgi:hypothetical protein
MTTQKGDSERTIFGIAYEISDELKYMYPGCVLGYFCEPPRHITVIIMKTDIEIFDFMYLISLNRLPGDTTEGQKYDLLTSEAKGMVVEIEKLIRDYGGRNLNLWVQHSNPRFWYSGPFFDNEFLDEDAHAIGAEVGFRRDQVDLLLSNQIYRLEKLTNQHVSKYSFPYQRKLQTHNQV